MGLFKKIRKRAKRTFKKIGRSKVARTVGDGAKFFVNASTPFGILHKGITGKDLVGSKRFKTKALRRLNDKSSKVRNAIGKVAAVATAVVGGGAVAGALGGTSGGLASLKKSKGLSFLKKLSNKSLKKPGGLPSFYADKVKNLNSGSTVKKLFSSVKDSAKKVVSSAGNSMLNQLTGQADTKGFMTSLIPKDSKLGGILGKLPSFKDIFNGSVEGATDVITGSEAANEVKKEAAKDWFKDNAQKIGLGFMGLVVLIMTFFLMRKSSGASRRRF